MFTGLIKDVGTVVSAASAGGGKRIQIETNMELQKIAIGASVACSGVCLTVTDKEKNSFYTDVSEETLNKTVIGEWGAGTRVNLEPSLHLGDEIGGHFVFGHVDGRALIKEIAEAGNSRVVTIEVDAALSTYLAPKGSVALDGISLTVNAVRGNEFTVSIIPHTWERTTFHFLKAGDAMNIEIDMLARYVGRMLGKAV